MSSSLGKNFFELLDVPESMMVDLAALRDNYRQVMKQVHPDLHVTGTEAEQAESIRATAYVNDAWDTLRNPLKRAIYLLTLKGVVLEDGVKSNIDPAFLMQQMELREQLEECVQEKDIDKLDDIEDSAGKQIAELSVQFAGQHEDDALEDASKTVEKLQFMSKFMSDIEAAREKLEDET